MADKSAIEWTDATWNPIRARHFEIQGDGSGKERIGWHCEHVSEGCRFCYAERFNQRLGTGLEFKPGELYREEYKGFHNGEVKLFLDETMLTQPLRWKKPRTIFVCSMTDLFADFVPDEFIDRMFAVMALSPQHTFQVLTKRAKRMHSYISDCSSGVEVGSGDVIRRLSRAIEVLGAEKTPSEIRLRWPLPNVWLGVSTERQQEADERIPLLLQTPAAVRFISAEPLLGPIDLVKLKVSAPSEVGVYRTRDALTGAAGHNGPCGWTPSIDRVSSHLDWVIVGGESGPGARPMHPAWARSLRDQCLAAGVPFFFKQWGEWAPNIGAVDGWTISDNPEISRFDHREWEDGRWSETFRPMWCDFSDGNYDEEQCVSRIGKKAAGRLLDGVEHNGLPAVLRA